MRQRRARQSGPIMSSFGLTTSIPVPKRNHGGGRFLDPPQGRPRSAARPGSRGSGARPPEPPPKSTGADRPRTYGLRDRRRPGVSAGGGVARARVGVGERRGVRGGRGRPLRRAYYEPGCQAVKLLDSDTRTGILRGGEGVLRHRAAEVDEVATTCVAASELCWQGSEPDRSDVLAPLPATYPALPPDRQPTPGAIESQPPSILPGSSLASAADTRYPQPQRSPPCTSGRTATAARTARSAPA